MYDDKVNSLTEELEELQEELEQQTNNNKLKGQLEDIRKKMNDLQKGEIEKIEFIVNEI